MIDHVEINLVKILKKYLMKKQIGGFNIDRGQKKQKLVSTAKKRTNRMGIFDKKIKSL